MRTNGEIRAYLFEQLKANYALWSYDKSTMTADTLTDEQIIEKVLMHLDMDDINILFLLFPKERIKEVWKWNLCALEFYYSSNVLFAGLFFNIKNPPRYVKMQAQRIVRNNLKGHNHARSIAQNI